MLENLFSPADAAQTSPAPLKGDPPKILRFRTIWISDLHLGMRGTQAEQLLDFLRHTESEFLYLVGDIVDAWQLKKRWYWPQTHNEIVQNLLKRTRKGTRVYYIPGNHDEAARDFCGLYLGDVPIVSHAIHVTASGQRLLVMHGDEFDTFLLHAKWLGKLGNTAYNFLLRVNTVLNAIRRRFGFSYWSLSAYLKSKVKNAIKYITAYETLVANEARHQKVDGVVCGHIHQAVIHMIGPVLYCNDGDWVESCTALVEDLNGNLSLIDWLKERDSLLEPAVP